MNVQRYFSLEFPTGILNCGVGMMIYLEIPYAEGAFYTPPALRPNQQGYGCRSLF